jgi:hypothetical protein
MLLTRSKHSFNVRYTMKSTTARQQSIVACATSRRILYAPLYDIYFNNCQEQVELISGR